MQRIIMHWTAGWHRANPTDRAAYHILIEGDGSLVMGDMPISANRAPIHGRHAAHTLNLNSDSIGVSMCGMVGSQERPFRPGSAPLTERQVEAMVQRVAALAQEYGIPVTRETILSHAEVQPTLGVRQRWKWDITWLPGWSAVRDPVEVGDMLRTRIAEAMGMTPAPVQPRPGVPVAPPAPRPAPAMPMLRLTWPWARGDAVRALQERIGATPDGVFGPATDRAVRAFQSAEGLTVDGIAGPQTWAALHELRPLP